MKKCISLVLAFVFAVGICASAPITITASAVDAVANELKFSLDETGEFYWVYDCSEYVASSEIVIPSEYNNLPVKKIGYGAFSYCDAATIIISEGIVSIASFAFEECYNLTSVYIPKSITCLGVEAFDCTEVKDVFYGGSSDDWTNIYFENELYEEYDSYSIENVGERIHYNVTDVSAHYNKTIVKPSTCTEIGKMSLSCSCGHSYTEEIEMLEHNYVGDSCNVCGRIAWDYGYGSLYNYLGTSKDVVIPASIDGEKIDTIYGSCFAGNENIETITIPESITYLKYSALAGVPNLKTINVSEKNENYKSVNGVLFDKNMEILMKYPENKSDTIYNIPSGVKSISVDAFSGNDNLKTVNIPGSVRTIEERAFSSCESLANIVISDEVQVIGEYAFDDTAYYNDASNWENDVLYICTHLIEAKESLSGDYVIKSGTKSIAEYAFSNCDSLTKVTIPNGLTSIGNSSFYECDYLTNVIMPNSVTSIGSSAFSDCTLIDDVTLPSGITSIEYATFKNCSSLTSVVIPNDVTVIGERAFMNCSSLTEITIPDTVTSIDYEAFDGTALYNDSSEWDNGVLYISNCLIEVKSDVSGSYTIKNGTKCIADWAFYLCGITDVTIPNSVTSIGNSAFGECYLLETVELGNNVTNIGNSAFEYCDSLKEIKLPDSIKIMGDCIFRNSRSLTSVTIPFGVSKISTYAFGGCSGLKEVIIPNSVTIIGDAAFSGCTGLQNIRIPDSVEIIEEYAFYDCVALMDVAIPNSVIRIEENAFGYAYNEGEYGLLNGFTIYSESGTTAEKYAKENGIEFVLTHTHSYTSTVTKQPTCTGTGTKTFTCSCGDSYTETLPATGHKEVTVTGKAPTCTETGLTDGKKCSVCNTVTKAQETIKAKGHTTSVINKKDATCTSDGYIGDTYCSTCKTTTVKGSVIKATGHKWNNGSVTTQPTCVKQGEKTYVCTVCYESKSEIIPETGHKEVVIPAVAPTFTTVGKTEGKKCSVCGTITVAQKDVAKLTLATPVATVKNSATGVKVTWKAIDGAESYKVYRKTYSTKTKKYGSWKTCGTVKTTSYVDTKAKSGTKYIYTVKALNGDVKSSIKSSSSILYLSQPTVKIANNASGVKVSWNKITGATGYKVYRSVYSGGKWSGWKSVKTISEGSTVSWTDKSVKSGVKYKYTVKAVNGKTGSTYKSSSSLLYLAQPKVAVKALSNGIKVAWVQSTGATSYKIYRSEYNAKTKKWSSWKGIKTAKSTSKSYVDKTAKKGVKYRYTVKAVNGKVASSYKSSSSVKR